MGAAIAIGYANQRNIDSIDGLILVAPAIWNFTEQNPIKSFILRVLSNFFPNSKVSGKGIIKVRPSDNIEMLKKLNLGLGGSLANAIVVKDDQILNEEKVRS